MKSKINYKTDLPECQENHILGVFTIGTQCIIMIDLAEMENIRLHSIFNKNVHLLSSLELDV